MTGNSVQKDLTQLAQSHPGAGILFDQLGIRPAEASQSLEQWTRSHGLEARAMLEVILAEDDPIRAEQRADWSAAGLDQLADHIVATHHEFVRRALRRIQLLLDMVQHQEGHRRPELALVRQEFQALAAEMQSHLLIEEQVLFPSIRQLAQASWRGARAYDQIDPSIQDMNHNHAEIDRCFSRLRALLRNFSVMSDDSPAYRTLMQELIRFDADLRRHCFLENDILFPRALALQRALAARNGGNSGE